MNYSQRAKRVPRGLAEDVKRSLRGEMGPLEEARLFHRLMEAGFRQYEIAARIGRSQSYVSRQYGLLRLAKPDPAPEVAPEPVAEVPAEPVAEPAPPVEEEPPEHDSMASPTLGRTLFNYVLSHASADVALCVAQTFDAKATAATAIAVLRAEAARDPGVVAGVLATMDMAFYPAKIVTR